MVPIGMPSRSRGTVSNVRVTSEVLRIIATSPTDLQPVLDTLIANAVRLAGARQGHIREYDGELLRFVAHYNESPEQIAAIKASPSRVRPESYTGRAIIERRPVHILDDQAEPRPGSLSSQVGGQSENYRLTVIR